MLIHANINGEYRYPGQAMIAVNDLGLLRSFAVFDYLRTYNKKPFRIDDYLERLRYSAGELGLPIQDDEEIKFIVKELIRRSDPPFDVGVRFLLTGGTTPDGMSMSRPTFIITVEKLFVPTEEEFQKGVKLITFEFQREIPLVKTTNYQNALRNLKLKEQKDAYELLYHKNGNILETSRNNFFIFKGNRLITPRENILLGITRKVVLELGRDIFEIEERDLSAHDINEASEAFITGTTKKVLPVVKIDHHLIGTGEPGENTKKIMRLFEEYTQG